MVSSNVKPFDPVLGFMLDTRQKSEKNSIKTYVIKHVLYQVMTPRCYSERYPVGIGPRPIRKLLGTHFLISI